MIVARFFCREGRPRGFTVSGHAGYAEAGSDIVCAAATSAVQLVCNTITDVLCEEAQVSVEAVSYTHLPTPLKAPLTISPATPSLLSRAPTYRP